jgi:site-specific recombinase XerC
VAGYLAAHVSALSVATLVRRLASISVTHEARGYPNPAKSPLVRAAMRGIGRDQGRAQRQAKSLLKEDLLAVLAAMGSASRDLRDRALLLIGFAGGFRCSELNAINCKNVERVRQGPVVAPRRSKTDQEGVGRRVGIPLGRSKACSCAALENWLAAARIADRLIFCSVDRHGRICAVRLSWEAVSIIVKDRVAAAGTDPARSWVTA